MKNLQKKVIDFKLNELKKCLIHLKIMYSLMVMNKELTFSIYNPDRVKGKFRVNAFLTIHIKNIKG